MNYNTFEKYAHLLIVVPVLLYVSCKGLNDEKVNKYAYMLLLLFSAIIMINYTGIINMKKLIEGFEENIFSTGILNRNDKKWFEPKTHIVEIIDYSFKPEYINVSMGDTVKWINKDKQVHSVNSYTDLFDSGRLEQGDSYSFKFSGEGTYNYFCIGHPYMKGSISSTANSNRHDSKESELINPLVKGFSNQVSSVNSNDQELLKKSIERNNTCN